MEKEKKPPFASGELVGDYSPLFEYWRVARERGREDLVEAAMLSEADYKLLRDTVKSGEAVLDLVDRLAEKIVDRVDPEIAAEALARSGVRVPPEEARWYIARLIASWLIEAGDYWGLIRLRKHSSGKGGES